MASPALYAAARAPKTTGVKSDSTTPEKTAFLFTDVFPDPVSKIPRSKWPICGGTCRHLAGGTG
jgi:hypothetical protein